MTDRSLPSDGGRFRASPLRLAVALGDPERERALLPYLAQREDLHVSARCLSGDELLGAAREGRFELAVVAWDLHRLLSTTLQELRHSGVRVILLAQPGDAP